MPKLMRTMTIDGRKYRVWRFDHTPDRLCLDGPGIVGGSCRLSSLPLDSADLRPFVVGWLQAYRENQRNASAAFQQALRDGIAGPAFM